MSDKFIITKKDVKQYNDAPHELLQSSCRKFHFIHNEVGKFIMSYENDNYKNGELIEGREPSINQIPGFIKTLIGKDIQEYLATLKRELVHAEGVFEGVMIYE